MRERPHPAAVVVMLFVLMEVGVLLATSERHGTGASTARGTTVDTAVAAPCPPTMSTPGGDNNYRPNVDLDQPLGTGLAVSGMVRDTTCRPLPGVRLHVWLQTASAREREHQTAVLTGPDGRYHVPTDQARALFGEPHVHVAHDERRRRELPDRFAPVFVRHVMEENATAAVVDLTLAGAGR